MVGSCQPLLTRASCWYLKTSGQLEVHSGVLSQLRKRKGAAQRELTDLRLSVIGGCGLVDMVSFLIGDSFISSLSVISVCSLPAADCPSFSAL
jgi:hypothetical protein